MKFGIKYIVFGVLILILSLPGYHSSRPGNPGQTEKDYSVVVTSSRSVGSSNASDHAFLRHIKTLPVQVDFRSSSKITGKSDFSEDHSSITSILTGKHLFFSTGAFPFQKNLRKLIFPFHSFW